MPRASSCLLYRRGGRATFSTSCRDLRVFNALSGQCEPFPRATSSGTRNVLKWYACGPTVYDQAHLGHARAYISQDILRRVAERTGGYKVLLVMGVTDVDDKIIKRAKQEQTSFHELARAQERQFFHDMARLYVKPPTVITRVSEHVPEIVAYVEAIEKNGFAYKAVDGSGLYFHTQKFGPRYGKLDPRRQTHHDAATHAEAMAAVEEEQEGAGDEKPAKHDPRDFALWKAAKDTDEPCWASPWGRGRPGWHIECSAMTHHVLGDQLDVHTGGIDLRFPHHNNEIAQCEAHNPTPEREHEREWCNHFVHFGHLYIRGRKMSKSLKNFISVREFLAQGYTADHLRLMCLQFKYRTNFIYSKDRVADAAVVIDRLRSFFRNVLAYGGKLDRCPTNADKSKRCGPRDLELLNALFATQAQVDEVLLDDVDTPAALSLVLDLVSRGNTYLIARREASEEAPEEVLLALTTYVLEVLDLFGLEGLHAEFSAMMRRRFFAAALDERDENDRSRQVGRGDDHEALLRSLINFRAAVRAEALRDPKQPSNGRLLALCDTLRNEELPPLGVQIEDLAPGRSVYKVLSLSERAAAQQPPTSASPQEGTKHKDPKAGAQDKKQQEMAMMSTPSVTAPTNFMNVRNVFHRVWSCSFMVLPNAMNAFNASSGTCSPTTPAALSFWADESLSRSSAFVSLNQAFNMGIAFSGGCTS
ncbi:hypothetical protein PsorP6_019117 [Peronosclerospora sorghi]|nr:hypothetical protein PsorP6_019117 [Peronosclerospora sorghi]